MINFIEILLAAAIVALGSGALSAQNREATRPIQEQERAALTPSARMLETGQDIARAACASCHGMDGVSMAEGEPHLAGQRAVYLYRRLLGFQSKEGETGFGQHASSFLNDDAMLAVAAYYASLSPAPVAVQAEPEDAPATLESDPFADIRPAMKKCVRCHGETGNSNASGMPSLTAQHPDYFVESMKAYADGGRRHRLMNRLTRALDDATIEKMGVFYAVQEPLRTEVPGEGDVDRGRKAAEECATCHGDDGNASGPDMPTLAGQDPRYFVKAMEAYRNGERQHEKMVEAVEALSETDIADLASFYAAQQPVKRSVRVPLSSAEWIERCERCHGVGGNSTDPRFPMLAAQDKRYLKKMLIAFSKPDGRSATMHKMAEPLGVRDIEQIVNYFSTREPKSVLYLQLPCD